jgi:transposase
MATETHEMLVQVYGTKAVSRKCVYDWFKRFRHGKETTEDEPRLGRPMADPNVAVHAC